MVLEDLTEVGEGKILCRLGFWVEEIFEHIRLVDA